MANVGKMQEEALKRKERLKAFKQRSGGNDGETEPPEKKRAGDEVEKLPKPMFRSYKPQDETLKEAQLPQAKPVEVTDKVKDQLDASKPEPVVEEVDLINLAPRKPDWDLKRDVAKKLEKLDRRTQRAIAELIREQLTQGPENLVAAVDANIRANQDLDDED